MTSNSGNAWLRSLLPQPEEPSPIRLPSAPLVRKRKAIDKACEICRRRKTRECKYAADQEEIRFAELKRSHTELRKDIDELRNTQHDLQQFVEALRILGDDTIASIIQRLRQGARVVELARDVGTSSLLLQLYDRAAAVSQIEEVKTGNSTTAKLTHGNPNTDTQHRLEVVTSPYEELFNLLRTTRNQESLEILHSIRQGHDIHTILRKAKEANSVAQLSPVSENR
ncbi:c6 transcription factor [Fusarium longipes]|uniref:C6 transcription factor n=1 Tax=Fusarium longipes TaxID=694270 RepID=A0A395SH17_9HYPO|nr:c6 transcription factor [Fusarium longipes]